MSEEISRQIEAAAAARSREAASRVDPSHLAELIVAGATRRRRVRGFTAAAFAVVGVVAIAGGTVAAMSAWGPDAVAPATQSATPTSSETAEASTSPSPSVTTPVADVGLDGIADYPALAPARGEGFPSAYVMEDWVWDQVGTGWSLESFSMAWDPYTEPSPEIPNAVVYLVSPDGAVFELVALDRAKSGGLRVVSWREDERKALVWWEGDGTDNGDAAELDLETGVLDPLDFTMPGKVHSTWETPIAVNASGTELWAAGAQGVSRYYRWSPDDGWTVAAMNDLDVSGATGGFQSLGDFILNRPTYVRNDGSAVVFGRGAPGAGEWWSNPLVEIAVYDIERDVVTRAPAPQDVSGGDFARWSAPNSIEFSNHIGADAGLEPVTVQVNGAPALGPVPDEFIATNERGTTELSGVVGFGQATATDVLWRLCGC